MLPRLFLVDGVLEIVVSVLVERLEECFRTSHEEQFTGYLQAYSRTGQQWRLYFFMGRLIWGSGGSHRFRRWFRLLAKHLPRIDSQKLPEPNPAAAPLWEYVILSKLLAQCKVYSNAVSDFINETLGEVLFEVIQEAASFTKSATSKTQIEKLGSLITMVNPLQALRAAQSEWEQWIQNGLISYSPNFAPVLKYPEKLRQELTESSYQKLSKLLNGRRSIREIATHLKVKPLTISQSLLPFINQGVIALQPIADWKSSSSSKNPKRKGNEQAKTLQENQNQPLIFCIDDSPAICQALEKVVTSYGYRFIGVQDSLKALPILIEKKPSLIFLDLVMPVASGYEICAQIRRIESFKLTPVIILTGKDGMVDRVRAKLVGASDFITKPVRPDKVLDTINRYLSIEVIQERSVSHLETASDLQDTVNRDNQPYSSVQYG